MSGRLAMGVGGRLFTVLVINALVAFTIGLGAYHAFGILHVGITEVTSRLFPSVVASAKLERQHQRIMRTIESLATVSNNLEHETVAQGLSDQLEGYDLLLEEMERNGGRAAMQVRMLKDQRDELLRLRVKIDQLVRVRIEAGQALIERDRDLRRLSDALEAGPWRRTDPAVHLWLEKLGRLLFLSASVHSIENPHALATSQEVAARELAEARALFLALPQPARTAAGGRQAAIENVVAGPHSVFSDRQTQLESTQAITGLLNHANEISLLNTGLNTGAFTEQTSLAEERRQQIIRSTEIYSRLFFVSIGIVIVGLGVTLFYLQRRVVARLSGVCQAIRDKIEGLNGEIPVEGHDEISELASALRFFIHETEVKSEKIRENEHWLRLAKEQAEHADAAKTEFLATMSHEMRTPLNGILGLGRLLLAGRLSKVGRRHAEQIMQCGATLLHQLNDILDLRKIEDGKLLLDPAPWPVHPLLEDVRIMVASLAAEKNIALEIGTAPDVPAVIVCDQQRLRQILMNLLSNAVKFTERGAVRVWVGVERRADDERLVVSVADTGIGIPVARLGAIFGKLEQADSSIARRYGGTGLGLAIVKRLLEAMGGHIAVESVEGVGSTFTFDIPLCRAGEAPVPAFAGDGLRPPVEPLSLLLVEDHVINREVAIGLFEGHGHRLTVAETGREALHFAATERFDAILLDIRLPDIDGTEVARRIRALSDPSHAGVPIIALTADVFAGAHARYLDAGMDAVVEKPLDPDRLLSQLADITERRVPSSPLTSSPLAVLPPAPPEGGSDAGPLDEETLLRYRTNLGDQRFARILLLLYDMVDSDLPRLMADDADERDVADLAHRLAGAASNFGLDAFVGLMRDIERGLKEGRRADALALIGGAGDSFVQARQALDAWQRGLVVKIAGKTQ